jgi:hypothetical protein
VCLTRKERLHLESIASREDRDLGYLCSWFIEWGIAQYMSLGLSLVDLANTKMVRDKLARKWAEERLSLREEARRLDETNSDSSTERRRA